MMEWQRESKGGMPLSWFGTTPWDFTPHHADVVFPAICPRLIGPVEPVIFALILNRRPPFQCAASLIVGMAIFVAAGLGCVSRVVEILLSRPPSGLICA